MGTILASAIMDKVEADLNDAANDRWSETEHLANLNEGQRVLVSLKPDAYVVNDCYQLVASETKQRIPDGTASYQDPDSNTLENGIAFIDAIRNMGANGTTIGPAVRVVEKSMMDALDLDWHTATASAEVEVVIFDPKDPKVFWVSPPQPASDMGYLQIAYSAEPSEAATKAAAITLDDIYERPLIEYMKSRAYAKNAHYSPHAENMRRFHWNQFVTWIGRKELAETLIEPVKSTV